MRQPQGDVFSNPLRMDDYHSIVLIIIKLREHHCVPCLPFSVMAVNFNQTHQIKVYARCTRAQLNKM